MWILFISVAVACHPQCRYFCDDPVCNATCVPKCLPPACVIQCDTNSSSIKCYAPSCHVRCPPDMCESDACPSCETVCEPPQCFDQQTYQKYDGCQNLCEATSCAWECSKPLNCPQPRCELMCEQPACRASSASILSINLLFLFLLLL
jgi:hypothetical protein